MHWRRKWQPTPVFLPGESQGRGSLVGCRLWGRRESDMTEETQHSISIRKHFDNKKITSFFCFISHLTSGKHHFICSCHTCMCQNIISVSVLSLWTLLHNKIHLRFIYIVIISIQLLSRVQLFATPWTAQLVRLPAILILVCDSSSPAFLMMYSAYKLNKQGDNIQPWTYSFSYLEPVCCSMSSSNCCFLTCVHISQETGQVVWYSHLFQNFPQFLVIHIVMGFGISNSLCFFLESNAILNGCRIFYRSTNLLWAI